jgi:hypothetical protein
MTKTIHLHHKYWVIDFQRLYGHTRLHGEIPLVLKLFPTTLKDSALHWFMSLGEYSIRYWEDMKAKF